MRATRRGVLFEIFPPLLTWSQVCSPNRSRSPVVAEPVGQQALWNGYIEEFDCEVVHRAGVRHGNADALSRRPCRNKECKCKEDEGVSMDDEVSVNAARKVEGVPYFEFDGDRDAVAENDRSVNQLRSSEPSVQPEDAPQQRT